MHPNVLLAIGYVDAPVRPNVVYYNYPRPCSLLCDQKMCNLFGCFLIRLIVLKQIHWPFCSTFWRSRARQVTWKRKSSWQLWPRRQSRPTFSSSPCFSCLPCVLSSSQCCSNWASDSWNLSDSQTRDKPFTHKQTWTVCHHWARTYTNMKAFSELILAILQINYAVKRVGWKPPFELGPLAHP